MPDQQHKQDAGKPAFELIPPLALREAAKVMEFGARKYGPETWKQVDESRYLAAAYRHINAHHIGMGEDKESRINHLAHAIVNLMFILEKQLCETNWTNSLVAGMRLSQTGSPGRRLMQSSPDLSMKEENP